MSEQIIKAEVLAGILDDLAGTKPNAETCRMFLARAADSLRDLLALAGEQPAEPVILDLYCACCENATDPADLAGGYCPACVTSGCAAVIHPDSKPDPDTGRLPYTAGTGPRQFAGERPKLAADDFLFAAFDDSELSIVMASLRSGSKKQDAVWPQLCEAWWETKDLLSDAHQSFMLRHRQADVRPAEWVCSRCTRRQPGRKPEDGTCAECENHDAQLVAGAAVVHAADDAAVPRPGTLLQLHDGTASVEWHDARGTTVERLADLCPCAGTAVVPWTPFGPRALRIVKQEGEASR